MFAQCLSLLRHRKRWHGPQGPSPSPPSLRGHLLSHTQVQEHFRLLLKSVCFSAGIVFFKLSHSWKVCFTAWWQWGIYNTATTKITSSLWEISLHTCADVTPHAENPLWRRNTRIRDLISISPLCDPPTSDQMRYPPFQPLWRIHLQNDCGLESKTAEYYYLYDFILFPGDGNLQLHVCVHLLLFAQQCIYFIIGSRMKVFKHKLFQFQSKSLKTDLKTAQIDGFI